MYPILSQIFLSIPPLGIPMMMDDDGFLMFPAPRLLVDPPDIR